MTWTDTLDDDQRKEIAFARMYAKEFGHRTTCRRQLLLLAALAELLDQLSGALQLARLRTPVRGTPLEQLIAAARAAGAAGTWIVRGATGAALVHTDDITRDIADWPALRLTPPHQVIVLIRIPELPGGPDGIEFHGPAEE